MLKALDPGLFPYTQLSDTKDFDRAPFCAPGEGIVPLYQILDALPPNIHGQDDAGLLVVGPNLRFEANIDVLR
ncbi:MAG: hypothetical protein JO352_19465 [Chloroflexi bacterium]|nr:hypothetical protein [Chloroflexota bacterium]